MCIVDSGIDNSDNNVAAADGNVPRLGCVNVGAGSTAQLPRVVQPVHLAETGIVPKSAPDPDMTHFASVPGWLMALMLVASTDAIATCPRRLALRHAEKLGLQVLDLPVPPDTISVSVMRRSGAADEGAAWFLEQVRLAVEA